MITLILGGTRSGKSSFAEKMAYYRGQEDVIYIATAEILDEEMERRVACHQKNRPGNWKTIEETVSVAEELLKMKKGQVVLLDCITLLISNLLMKYEKKSAAEREKAILEKIIKIIEVSRKKKIEILMVSNEVGLGIVPAHKLGREYRDIAGTVNQFLAKRVDKVYFTIAGLPLEIQEAGLENLKKYDLLEK